MDRDTIVRVSGSNEDVEDFLRQVIGEVELLGIIPSSQSIRALPDKIRKEDVKNKKAKDVRVSVSGDEKKVDLFLSAIVEIITEETSLPQPSLNLKLESPDGA